MHSILLSTRRAALGALALACAALAAPAAWAQQKTVGITAIVEHPALDAIRKGAQDELRALGWSEDKLKVQYQSAQGSAATAGQIAKKFAGDKVDAIIAIATPSAQAAAAATRSIPIIYAAVTDPVAAKLVKSMEPAGGNITGVSDRLDIAPQVDLILKIKPGAKKVGMVYSPGEVNSTTVLERLKAKAAEQNIEVAAAPAQRSADVLTAARSLGGKADVIFTSLDNNVVSSYESMYKASMELKIPLVASDADSVTRGAVAALGMDSFGTGQKAGKLAAAVLKGGKPGDMPSEKLDQLDLYLSKKHAAALGIALPEALLKTAKEVKE